MYEGKIIGIGSYAPPKVYKNTDLEEMMDTSNEWIVQRTGIERRHWVDDENMTTSDMALEASKKAIENAGIEVKDIDMIVLATISGDHDFPGTGCFLQDKLGLNGITCLDIKQACSGFVYALATAQNFIRGGGHNNILVVGAELHSRGLDKSPNGRNISVLFGDGAGAVVVTKTQVKDKKNDSYIMDYDLHADGAYAKELWLPAPGMAYKERMSMEQINEGVHFAYMNGKVVFVHAIKRMCETLMTSLEKTGHKLEDIDMFFFHQANLRINTKVAETLNIPEEKLFNTIQEYGNTTAATIPIGMDEALKAGKLKPGMLVATCAFGSGFTWGSVIFRY